MRRRSSLVLVLAALAGAAACSSAGGGEAVDGAGAGLAVPFEELLRTVSSCHGPERGEAVLRDSGAWADWWRDTTCGGGEPPSVDFTRDLVLAVRDLEGPTGCYRVRIADVRTDVGGGLRIRVRRHVPEGRTPCPMVIVHPAHAVRVPLVRGPVTFEWEVVTGGPPGEGGGR